MANPNQTQADRDRAAKEQRDQEAQDNSNQTQTDRDRTSRQGQTTSNPTRNPDGTTRTP